MAKDKGNKGSQTGSGDKRKGANRADRGTSKASDKPPATKEAREEAQRKAQEEAQRKAQEEAQKKDPPKKG
jgi:hypothetical protein